MYIEEKVYEVPGNRKYAWGIFRNKYKRDKWSLGGNRWDKHNGIWVPYYAYPQTVEKRGGVHVQRPTDKPHPMRLPELDSIHEVRMMLEEMLEDINEYLEGS